MGWEPGTIFDFRGAVWRSFLQSGGDGRNCFPIMLGADWGKCRPDRIDLYSGKIRVPTPGPPLCLVGGSVIGTQPLSATWKQVKGSGGRAVTVNARRARVKGMRIHNAEDAFIPFRSGHFVLQGNWVTYNRDDCIENDAFASGVIEDNLFDGCYVFYSAANKKVQNAPIAPEGGSQGLVTIRKNLIRLQNMPGPYKKPDDASGFGRLFKTYDSRTPSLALHENIFLIEEPIDRGKISFNLHDANLESCSGNVIVWLGKGEYPSFHLKNCFTVTRDGSIWKEARRHWIERHPGITRLVGDDPG
jgi:hypothetical protein